MQINNKSESLLGVWVALLINKLMFKLSVITFYLSVIFNLVQDDLHIFGSNSIISLSISQGQFYYKCFDVDQN